MIKAVVGRVLTAMFLAYCLGDGLPGALLIQRPTFLVLQKTPPPPWGSDKIGWAMLFPLALREIFVVLSSLNFLHESLSLQNLLLIFFFVHIS